MRESPNRRCPELAFEGSFKEGRPSSLAGAARVSRVGVLMLYFGSSLGNSMSSNALSRAWNCWLADLSRLGSL